jgi:hypothetical protein
MLDLNGDAVLEKKLVDSNMYHFLQAQRDDQIAPYSCRSFITVAILMLKMAAQSSHQSKVAKDVA